MARAAGVPTISLIELYSQKCYFAFQIIQVFLITTLTSAASAAAAQIVEDPDKAESLLSKNLPTASNFYISYILVECLGFGSSLLIHAATYVRLHVMQKVTSNPRRLWQRWHRLRPVHWGMVFPVYTNLGVIGDFIPQLSAMPVSLLLHWDLPAQAYTLSTSCIDTICSSSMTPKPASWVFRILVPSCTY